MLYHLHRPCVICTSCVIYTDPCCVIYYTVVSPCRWHQLATEAADDIAMLMTAECGKPLAEAKAEIAGGWGGR